LFHSTNVMHYLCLQNKKKKDGVIYVVVNKHMNEFLCLSFLKITYIF